MRRRSRAGGEPVKTRRRKTAARKRGYAPKAVRRRSSSAADKETKVALFKRERDEALEQFSGASEVLKVIGSSSGDLKPVFQTMLAKAVGLCQAKFGVLWLREGDRFRSVALHNVPVSQRQAREREPLVQFGPHSGSGRAIRTKRAVHIPDLMNDEGYLKRDTRLIALVETGGARAAVFTPLLKDNEVIGILVVFRQEVGPFTDRQMALVENFAAQAVIAIENTRLLNELRQRTDDLTKSLEQQTATADVLRVISSSPGELNPVFNAMLENAVRLCEAEFGHLFLYDREAFHTAALHSASQDLAEVLRRRPVVLRELHPDVPLARMARTKAVVHIADVRTEKSYIERNPIFSEFVDVSGARAILIMPMLKENELIGAFVIYRLEVRAFTDKQVELVKNFAAQAVIAIENTRLLNELRQRTTDLTESLEQQTATSDVLSVISSSPGNLNPVFEAILANAVRICKTHFGVLLLFEGGRMRVVAMKNAPHAFAEMRRRDPYIPLEKSILGPVVRTKTLAHVSDITAEEPYASSPLAKVGGARTALGVPMLKEGELVGAIAFYRQEVNPFSEKQIGLLQNFASQAVIAIENARLLNELRESLDRQTATSEVLSVISSSPGELQPVFQAMLENATRLCEAKFGALQLRENGAFRVAAMHNPPPAYAEARRQNPLIVPSAHSALGRVIATKQLVHITDYTQELAYKQRDPLAVSIVDLAGARTLVIVPMLKEGELIGNFVLYRQEVRPFTEKQIALLTNFAAQAVIAIENARLLNELRQRTDDLTESLQQQTATSEILDVISNSPTELAAGIQRNRAQRLKAVP